jgi:hypothetical protein
MIDSPPLADAPDAEPVAILSVVTVEPGDPDRSGATKDRARRTWSWRLSRWLHGLIVGAIAAELLAGVPLSPLIPQRPLGEQIELTITQEAVQPAVSLTRLAISEEDRPTADEIAAAEIERQAREAIGPELAAELIDAGSAPSPVASHWVQQRMLDEIAAAQQASTEDRHRRLAQLGQQLENISSAESVDAAAGRLANLLGTGRRATQPAAEPVSGDFDLDSAQLHDVKRTENASGGYDYVAVLLDSAGRTMESSLTEIEGAQLYGTFEIMKANPLLERVYRGVVMALLDKLTRPGAAAAPQPPLGNGR